MEDGDQVEAFKESGRIDGALDGLYVFHSYHCTKVIQGCRTVIDLGCGPGVPLIKLARLNPHIHFIGFDLSENMLANAKSLAEARQLKNIELRKMDFTDLSEFQNQSVDAVISLQAFHHLPKYEQLEKVFQETSRVLKPDGAVYFMDLIRFKSQKTARYLAYYDDNASPITQLDAERSMMAAFKFADMQTLTQKYLPSAKCYKTAILEMHGVVKTADRPLAEEVRPRLRSMLDSLRKNSRMVFNDVQFFHKLGGLK